MFQPRYVKEDELLRFGLPTVSEFPDILTLVDRASTLIDEHCGRRTEDNMGSILYSTVTEAIPVRRNNGNCLRLSFKPLVALPPTTQQVIAASGQAEVGENGEDFFYTGFEANTTFLANGDLSPIISIQAFYGSMPVGGLTPFYQQMLPILEDPSLVPALPAVAQTNFDSGSGDIWVPSGIYPIPYVNVIVKYNAGFDPLNIPQAVKFATASLVRNLIMRGGGTTGLKGYSGAGKMTMNFTEDLIDASIDLWLRNFKVIVVR